MATVLLNNEAREELDALPIKIHGRVLEVIERLAKWPAVSGAKPLRHGLAGQYRVRTGDYRVQFTVKGDVVTIVKIGKRDGFYED
ncbi:MAG TPA: type II toxin-antitoxin system RelE/ParE family toxin [Tepidisphaeraceae bacterium]|nr:type II toxin-antitoxin system RelE/ParE family toxin [Tepidisphaeraceae bacterium]